MVVHVSLLKPQILFISVQKNALLKLLKFNLADVKQEQNRTHSPKPAPISSPIKPTPTKSKRNKDTDDTEGALVYEFQKQENGELKVITTRDVSTAEYILIYWFNIQC